MLQVVKRTRHSSTSYPRYWGGADLSAVTVGAGVSGERGVLTTRAVAAGDVILRVPVNKAINVGPASITASEAAIKLLRETYKKVRERTVSIVTAHTCPPSQSH